MLGPAQGQNDDSCATGGTPRTPRRAFRPSLVWMGYLGARHPARRASSSLQNQRSPAASLISVCG